MPTISSFPGSRNSWLSSDFSTPPNTRCRRCGFASSSAFESGGVMDHISLKTRGAARLSKLAFALVAVKTQASENRRWSACRRVSGGAKALDEPGRGRVGRSKERATTHLAGIVAEPLARGVDQARARFLEQKIGGGDVPVMRVLGRGREIDPAARHQAHSVGERRHTWRNLDRSAKLGRNRLNNELGA